MDNKDSLMCVKLIVIAAEQRYEVNFQILMVATSCHGIEVNRSNKNCQIKLEYFDFVKSHYHRN